MRILHVVPTYLPAVRYGGPIRSVHGLCAGLARRGHDVHVLTTNVDGSGVSPVPIGTPVRLDGVSVTYFRTGLGRRIYRSPDMGVELERAASTFDVVHIHAVFLWPTTAAAAAARRSGIPYVLSPRGMLVPELIDRKSSMIKRAWIALFDRRNLAAAAAIHVTSALEEEAIRRLGLPAREFAIVPNGVDVELDSGDVAVAPMDDVPGPIVLFLGRINWKKGLDRLIPAVARVPGAQLVVVGNDEENYLPAVRELAIRHGVADRMHVLGPLDGARKWKAFAAADVFVLPSYSENFGIAALEAMAAGTPVILTPEVGLASIVAETGAGLVVDGEPEKIAAAIARLLGDAPLRQRMGEAGRDAAARQFSWDAIAGRMEQIYLDVCGRPAASPHLALQTSGI